MTARTDHRGAPAVRPRARPPAVASTTGIGRLVVVTAAEEIPAWVAAWCSGRHRELRTYRTCPDLGHPEGPSGAEHVRAVAGLVGALVLVIRPDLTADRPACVAAAVRDLDAEAAVVLHAAEVASESAAYLTVLHAVPRSFGERSVGLEAAVEHGRMTIAEAAERVATDAPGVPVVPSLVRAHPHEAVGEALDADLLVLGGPRPGDTGPGLVIRSALQHAPCPVLLVPRRG